MNRLTLFLTLTLSAILSIAQLATDKINPKAFNHKLFEQTLQTKINDYRIQNKLRPLVANNMIYKVAQDHSEFLKNKAEITHDQPIAGKQTVQNRLEYYLKVKKYEVGENIARTFVLKPTYNYQKDGTTKLSTAQTYEEAATYMLNAWLQSEFHRNNILNANYQLSGLASYYNPVNQSLTAVQVFAKIG